MPRIDQIFSSLGYGSRREARAWAEAGRITVDGKAVKECSLKADPAKLLIDGEALDHPDGLFLMLHKPVGLVCSHDPGEGPSVYSLLPERWRRRNPLVTSIGRLDKDTSGLLLLTDQAPWVHRLTSPKNKVAKVYRVMLDRAPPDSMKGVFASGILLLPGETEPCAPAPMVVSEKCEIELTMTEGRFRQVRRMVTSQGCQVLALHRVRFGSIDLGGLQPGQWVHLPPSSFEGLVTS